MGTTVQVPLTGRSSGAESYARLLLRLHELSLAGREESPEADALRDEMTWHWYRMSAREQDLLTGLSADLNDLEAGGARSVDASPDEVADYRARARVVYESGDGQQMLEFLRKPYPKSLPAGAVPFLQARVWQKLGYSQVAIVFIRETARHDGFFDLFVTTLLDNLGRLPAA